MNNMNNLNDIMNEEGNMPKYNAEFFTLLDEMEQEWKWETEMVFAKKVEDVLTVEDMIRKNNARKDWDDREKSDYSKFEGAMVDVHEPEFVPAVTGGGTGYWAFDRWVALPHAAAIVVQGPYVEVADMLRAVQLPVNSMLEIKMALDGSFGQPERLARSLESICERLLAEAHTAEFFGWKSVTLVPQDANKILNADKGIILVTESMCALRGRLGFEDQDANMVASDDEFCVISNEKAGKYLGSPIVKGSSFLGFIAVFPVEKALGELACEQDGEGYICETNTELLRVISEEDLATKAPFQVRGRCLINRETGARAHFNALKGKLVILTPQEYDRFARKLAEKSGMSDEMFAMIDPANTILAPDMLAKRMKENGIFEGQMGVNYWGSQKFDERVTVTYQVLSRALTTYEHILGKGTVDGDAYARQYKLSAKLAEAIKQVRATGETTLLQAYMKLEDVIASAENMTNNNDFNKVRVMLAMGLPFGAADMGADKKASEMLIRMVGKSHGVNAKGFWQYLVSPFTYYMATGKVVKQGEVVLSRKAYRSLKPIIQKTEGYLMAHRNPVLWGEGVMLLKVVKDTKWNIDGIVIGTGHLGGHLIDHDFDGDTVNLYSPYEVLSMGIDTMENTWKSYWSHVNEKMSPYLGYVAAGANVKTLVPNEAIMEPMPATRYGAMVAEWMAGGMGIGAMDNMVSAMTSMDEMVPWELKAVAQSVMQGMKHASKGGISAFEYGKFIMSGKDMFDRNGAYQFKNLKNAEEAPALWNTTLKLVSQTAMFERKMKDSKNFSMDFAAKMEMWAHTTDFCKHPVMNGILQMWADVFNAPSKQDQWKGINWTAKNGGSLHGLYEVEPFVAFVMGGNALDEFKLRMTANTGTSGVGTLLNTKTIFGWVSEAMAKVQQDMDEKFGFYSNMEGQPNYKLRQMTEKKLRGDIMNEAKSAIVGFLNWHKRLITQVAANPNLLQEVPARRIIDPISKAAGKVSRREQIINPETKEFIMEGKELCLFTDDDFIAKGFRFGQYMGEPLRRVSEMSAVAFAQNVATCLFVTYGTTGNSTPLYSLGQELTVQFMSNPDITAVRVYKKGEDGYIPPTDPNDPNGPKKPAPKAPVAPTATPTQEAPAMKTEKMIDGSTIWADYSRRNDPAHIQGVEILRSALANEKVLPAVLCFWTKNPGLVAKLYAEDIKILQSRGTTVIAYVTATGYGKTLEPGVPATDLTGLIELLGAKAVRLRFDPIIVGYTLPSHFQYCLDLAVKYGITDIIVNFYMPYKDTMEIMNQNGVAAKLASTEDMLRVLGKLHDMAAGKVTLRACAETHIALIGQTPEWLGHASCADPDWARIVNPKLGKIIGHASREGCGCVYSKDFGKYASKGGYKCPHRCLYCYAK